MLPFFCELCDITIVEVFVIVQLFSNFFETLKTF